MIEVAIVMIIMSLAIGGAFIPLNARIEQQGLTDSANVLNDINEALAGFAIRNGRLPCPASGDSNGIESPQGGGVCTHPYDGYVPAVSLGLGHLDENGYILDAWNNRMRYAVAKVGNSAFTTENGMKTAGLTKLESELHVCGSATGANATDCDTATALTSESQNAPPAVVFSTGKNGLTGGTSADEKANLDNNPVFVSHTPTPVDSPTGEFDDIVSWLSPNILYGQMVNAGQLP